MNIDKQISELMNEFSNSKKLEDDKRKLLTDIYDKLLDKNTPKETIQKILNAIKELLTSPNIAISDKHITINLLSMEIIWPTLSMEIIQPTFDQYKNEKKTSPKAQLNIELINAIFDTYFDIIKKLSTENGNDVLIEILVYALIYIIMYSKNENLELQNKILENINNLAKSNNDTYKKNGMLYLKEIENRAVNEDIKNSAQNMINSAQE